ncbi:DNA-3-methyladenine glycosylase I [Candidatus Latescibacterota bacterium]
MGSKRCDWTGDDPLMQAYHDEEWGVPLHDDARHFEFVILDGAQAGLSWSTILKKRDNYRKAFDGFEVEKVARYTPRKIARLLEDEGIVRNRLKIQSAVTNARAFLEVQEEFGSFDAYIWRFVGGKTLRNKWKTMAQIPSQTEEAQAMSRDLKKRGFSFVGPTICYAYMQAAGLVNDHVVGCFRYRQVSGKA